jgi:hypothetical protein
MARTDLGCICGVGGIILVTINKLVLVRDLLGRNVFLQPVSISDCKYHKANELAETDHVDSNRLVGNPKPQEDVPELLPTAPKPTVSGRQIVLMAVANPFPEPFPMKTLIHRLMRELDVQPDPDILYAMAPQYWSLTKEYAVLVEEEIFLDLIVLAPDRDWWLRSGIFAWPRKSKKANQSSMLQKMEEMGRECKRPSLRVTPALVHQLFRPSHGRGNNMRPRSWEAPERVLERLRQFNLVFTGEGISCLMHIFHLGHLLPLLLDRMTQQMCLALFKQALRFTPKKIRKVPMSLFMRRPGFTPEQSQKVPMPLFMRTPGFTPEQSPKALMLLFAQTPRFKHEKSQIAMKPLKPLNDDHPDGCNDHLHPNSKVPHFDRWRPRWWEPSWEPSWRSQEQKNPALDKSWPNFIHFALSSDQVMENVNQVTQWLLSRRFDVGAVFGPSSSSLLEALVCASLPPGDAGK